MIMEDYVSRETYKLLKEKGYNGEFKTCYNMEEGYTYTALHLYDAMKWLREKHHIVIDVGFENNIFEADDSITITYSYTIWRFNKKWPHGGYAAVDGEEKNSYEEACEAAIKYCLENFI